MITALIVDDERKSIFTLQKIIEDYCPDTTVIGTAENIRDAKALILSQEPQLVFLDVEMPFGNGFELLRGLDNIAFEIVFVTAYDQYAIEAFKYASVDYLLKPVNISELQDTLIRVKRRILEKSNAASYIILKQNLDAATRSEQHILLSGRSESYPVKLSEISYCLADGSYTFIHMTGNRRFHASRNLKEYEDLLPKESFFRIHHGHIVNMSHIVRLKGGRMGYVLMRDGRELEIAARRKSEFLSVFQKAAAGRRLVGAPAWGAGCPGIRPASTPRKAGARLLIKDRQLSTSRFLNIK